MYVQVFFFRIQFLNGRSIFVLMMIKDWLTEPLLARLNYFHDAWPSFEWLTHFETTNPPLGSLIHFFCDWPTLYMNDPLLAWMTHFHDDWPSFKWLTHFGIIVPLWGWLNHFEMIDPLLGSLTHFLVTDPLCIWLYFGINDPTSGWQIHFWDVWPTN